MTRLILACVVALSGCESMVGAPEDIPEWAEPAAPTGDEPAADPCESASFSTTPPRLLTRYEYDNAVLDLFGDDGAPAEAFPRENSVAGFRTDVQAHRASALLIERYASAAQSVAQRAVLRDLPGLAPCGATESLADCGERFVAIQGRRAFRRPLDETEAAIFERLFLDTLPVRGYAGAIAATLQAMLQSPQFLYRIEPNPSDAGLDGYSIASRLSFLLWRSVPDDELLTAAAEGDLVDSEDILDQVSRMRADPKAARLYRDFASQWLGLDRFDGFARDALSDAEEASVSAQLRTSAVDFVSQSFRAGFDHLMTSPELALGTLATELYDPGAPRSGLLTHPALLTLLATPYSSSPIRRGVYVREHLFCEPLPAPPADANIEPPDPDPNATTRERFAQHTSNAGCAACHVRIDPIGFGFEAYDELGRHRDRENGFEVDTRGEVVGAADPTLNGEFDGLVELSQRLAGSEQVRTCVASEFFRFSMGGAAGENDACSAHRVAQALVTTGSFDSMIETLVTSDAFRLRRVSDPADAGSALDSRWLETPDWVADSPPTVALDEATLSELTGWADDVDAPDVAIAIEVYAGAPLGIGRFVGGAVTELDRPDAPAGRGFRVNLANVEPGETLYPTVFDPLNGAVVSVGEVALP